MPFSQSPSSVRQANSLEWPSVGRLLIIVFSLQIFAVQASDMFLLATTHSSGGAATAIAGIAYWIATPLCAAAAAISTRHGKDGVFLTLTALMCTIALAYYFKSDVIRPGTFDTQGMPQFRWQWINPMLFGHAIGLLSGALFVRFAHPARLNLKTWLRIAFLATSMSIIESFRENWLAPTTTTSAFPATRHWAYLAVGIGFVIIYLSVRLENEE